jgi:hypothetical protein
MGRSGTAWWACANGTVSAGQGPPSPTNHGFSQAQEVVLGLGLVGPADPAEQQ